MLFSPLHRGRALICAFGLAMMLLAAPASAQQSTLIPPGIGSTDMPALRTYLTNAFSSVVQCFQGTTAPAVGAAGAKLPYQCWNDTSASPTITHRIWNASTSTWIPAWTLDISANSFSVGVSSTINAQIGTSYTVVDGDRGKLIDFSNASAVAVTQPQAGASGLFLSGWYATYRNSGAGDVTITPATSTVDGGATLVLKQGQSVTLRSDGTNYKSNFVAIGASTVKTLTNTTYDTAGTGNSFLINGLAAAANTGTGSVVRATSPTISAPTISGHPIVEGVTSTGATGTGNFVFSASPAFTGTPTAPTASANTNTTQLATTAYADAIAALKANIASPTFTGTAAAPTAAVDTNTTQLATTAFVLGQAAAATPLIDGSAAVGTSTRYARADHIHPTDTTRAPIASPTFTGTPAAPTAAGGTNTTQLATTAFVQSAVTAATTGVASIAGNTGAFTLGGLLTNSTNLLQVVAASKSDEQTGTSATLATTPSQQHQHDSAIKAHASISATCSASPCTLGESYNVSSITRTSTGVYVVNFTTAFASASGYGCNVTANVFGGITGTKATGNIGVTTAVVSGGIFVVNDSQFDIACYGRQ